MRREPTVCGARVRVLSCVPLVLLVIASPTDAYCFENEKEIERYTRGGPTESNRCESLFPIAFSGCSYLWLGTPPTSSGQLAWSAPHRGAKISAVVNLYTDRRWGARENYDYAASGLRALLRSGFFQLRRVRRTKFLSPGFPDGASNRRHAHRAAKELLPENYLWLGGLILRHRHPPDFSADMVFLSTLFIERELFPRGAKAGTACHGGPAHVVVYCKSGLHRSAAVVADYLIIKHLIMHGGMGKFPSLEALWGHYQKITLVRRLGFGKQSEWQDRMYMSRMRLQLQASSPRYRWILSAMRDARRQLSLFSGTLSYSGAKQRFYRPRNISVLPMLLSSHFAHELVEDFDMSG
mmetsp:Transcript_68164/g.190291  ORF Transcript_68164/g.190291 Transcript_68164/m.190291 type:complete len:352 (-) Transcript_68164:67-1122(-)